jgi:serine/threonine protein kinase
MEFVEGMTLRKALQTGGLPLRRAASLLRQAGRALAAIHAHAIFHRDLKPENLMIREVSAPNEDLVLIDFSIAIVKQADQTVQGLSRAAGTLQYMAPEQVMGYADAASDIYSLAKVTIEMITGKRLSELLPQAALDMPIRVRELLMPFPSPLSPASVELLSAALEFDPVRRPRDAAAFSARIAEDLESGG